MFHDVNWLAVIAAGAAWWILGAIWYTALFGKKWSALTGIGEDAGGNQGLIFGMTFVLEVMASAFLAGIMHLAGQEGLQAGLHMGAMIGFAFVFPSVWINNLYQRKPFALTAIDAGYMIAGLAIAGTIIGAWP